jgi:hypothetical protein
MSIPVNVITLQYSSAHGGVVRYVIPRAAFPQIVWDSIAAIKKSVSVVFANLLRQLLESRDGENHCINKRWWSPECEEFWCGFLGDIFVDDSNSDAPHILHGEHSWQTVFDSGVYQRRGHSNPPPYCYIRRMFVISVSE